MSLSHTPAKENLLLVESWDWGFPVEVSFSTFITVGSHELLAMDQVQPANVFYLVCVIPKYYLATFSNRRFHTKIWIPSFPT